ncbi:hypothetical protein [Bacillus sp. AG4(2022)]|uniref:hypothetical protein n=1 Tax=Bacillus sp. AG4(2022) TaxID=2962594 RepID=UPI00288266BB|nr:hypothetical protein [Bacillus sp. AG4(2022)]MDT0160411.1 hypothetical protein [Bacillus sp. AG4(2022)]
MTTEVQEQITKELKNRLSMDISLLKSLGMRNANIEIELLHHIKKEIYSDSH